MRIIDKLKNRLQRQIFIIVKCLKCLFSPFIVEGRNVKSTTTDEVVELNSAITCYTTNFIYWITCTEQWTIYWSDGQSQRSLLTWILNIKKGKISTKNPECAWHLSQSNYCSFVCWSYFCQDLWSLREATKKKE